MKISEFIEKYVNEDIQKTESPLYLALGKKNKDGSAVEEVKDTFYKRMPVVFEVVSDEVIQVNDDIEFEAGDNDWGTITHVAVFDSEKGGSPLVRGPFSKQSDIGRNDVLKIRKGNFSLSSEG